MFRQAGLIGFVLAVIVFAVPQVVFGAYMDGDTVPNFTIKEFGTGKDVSLYDYEGHIIVLDFFAYWCGPCKVAASELEPHIEQYYHNLGGNPSSIPVKLISINIQGGAEAQTASYISTYGLQTVWDDPSRAAYAGYARGGIPLIVIINGAAGTNYGQWEVLKSQLGYGTGYYQGFRTIINGVEKTSGKIKVDLGGDTALSFGASWNLNGGEWNKSGEEIEAPAGTYTINYKAVGEGWKEPVSEQVGITAGGTTAISRSYKLIGDLNEDGFLNLVDFAGLVKKWNFSGECREDFDDSGQVGFGDTIYLAGHWLYEDIGPGDADTYINYSESNFGNSHFLIVRNDTSDTYVREAFLRFNYSKQKGSVLRSAKLKLTPTVVQAGWTIRIRLIDDSQDSWHENGLSWVNRPAGSGAEVTFSSNELTANEPYLVDVTSLLKQDMNANKIASFHIDVLTESSTGYNIFASLEHPTEDWRCGLEVVLSMAGDLNNDFRVDLGDFAVLSNQWRKSGTADIAPGSGDGVVDVVDLKLMVKEWLEEIN